MIDVIVNMVTRKIFVGVTQKITNLITGKREINKIRKRITKESGRRGANDNSYCK